jgi:hypothetical protein
MMVRKFWNGVLILIVATLTACGGGGGGGGGGNNGGGGGGNNNGNGNNGGGNTGTITAYVPPANIVAARQANYASPFFASSAVTGNPPAAGSNCDQPSNVVYVLANTETYAAPDVAELSQQQAADYAEQAVIANRTTFGINSTTGYFNKRVQICVQKSGITTFDGKGQNSGFIAKSTDNESLSQTYQVNDFALNKRLYRRELVLTYQRTFFNTNNVIVDAWFSEGLAEFVAGGRPTESKASIIALATATNPITLITTDPLTVYPNYSPVTASVAYLFSQESAANGAGNPLTVIPLLFGQVNVNCGGVATACAIPVRVAFEQAFIDTLHKINGPPFPLRDDPANTRDDPDPLSNYQDNILDRLNEFL